MEYVRFKTGRIRITTQYVYKRNGITSVVPGFVLLFVLARNHMVSELFYEMRVETPGAVEDPEGEIIRRLM